MRYPGRWSVERRVGIWLGAVALLLAVVSLVVVRLPGAEILRSPDEPWLDLLDVRSEANLHTWFNVAVLAAGGVAFLVVGALHRSVGRRRWPWLMLAALCFTLSVDDLVSAHEKLERLGRALGGGSGALHFAWVVPGLLLAAAMLALGVVAAYRLPSRVRACVLIGLIVLVTAAVGLEMVGGWLANEGYGAAYVIVSHVEELLESVAAVILLLAPLRTLSWTRGAVSLEEGTPAPREPAAAGR